MRMLPFSFWFDLSRLAFESNIVITLRLMRMATGGHKAWTEAQLMVTEKVQTAMALGIENTFALASGRPVESIGQRSVTKYRRAVAKNRRRLSR